MTIQTHPKLEGFPVVVTIPVRWGHLDAFGHVNNTVFFRYFEDARIAYFEAIGMLEHMEAHKTGPILAETHARFRRPLAYGDTVLAGARVEDIGADRFEMIYRIVSLDQDAVASDGGGRVVMFDYASNTKATLPDSLRARIEALEGGGA